MIRKTKEKFKLNLLAESDRLKKRIAALLSELKANGPHAFAITPQDALETCRSFHDRLNTMLDAEAVLRNGLAIFKIEQPPCKETMMIQKVGKTPVNLL